MGSGFGLDLLCVCKGISHEAMGAATHSASSATTSLSVEGLGFRVKGSGD